MRNQSGGPGGSLARTRAVPDGTLAGAPQQTVEDGDATGQVTRGSLAMAVSIGANALGGLLFWLVAARVEASDSVGEASALFQSLLFVNFVASMGLPVVVGHYASGTSQRSADLANLAMVIRVAAAVISALLFLAIVGSADLFAPLWTWGVLPGLAIFVFLSVGAAMAVLFEVRLIALRLWRLVVLRSVLVAVTRLPLLLLVRSDDTASVSLGLFALATLPVAASGYVGYFWLRTRVDRSDRLIPRPDADMAEIKRYAGINWVGLLATQGPLFAIPVVVGLSVNSADNPAFYVAWSFGAITFLLPQMIGQVVLSEANLAASRVQSLFQALRLALVLTMVAALIAQFSAGLIADVYGPDYSDIRRHLPLVVAAGIAWSYISIGLAAARVREQHDEVLVISLVFVLATVVPAALLTPRYGSGAATWSWLAGNCLAAAVTGLFYLRWRASDAEAPVASQPSPPRRAGRNTTGFVVALLAIGLVAAGCSGSSDDSSPRLADATETPAASSTAPIDLVEGAIVTESFDSGITADLTNTTLDWIVVSGAFGIDEGRLRLTETAGRFPSMVVTPVGGPDGLIQTTMSRVSNQSGLIFRYVDANNYWALLAVPPFATWNLQRVVDGVSENVGNVGVASVADNTSVGVLLQRESITVLVQGRPRLLVEDDAHMTAGYAGMYAAEVAAQVPRWDDFIVVSIELDELNGPASLRNVPDLVPAPAPTENPIIDLRTIETLPADG